MSDNFDRESQGLVASLDLATEEVKITIEKLMDRYRSLVLATLLGVKPSTKVHTLCNIIRLLTYPICFIV